MHWGYVQTSNILHDKPIELNVACHAVVADWTSPQQCQSNQLGGFNLPLWKMMEWVTVGMMTFPIYGKMENVPNHQPVTHHWICPSWALHDLAMCSDYSSYMISGQVCETQIVLSKPVGSMYAIYGNIYHQHTPNVSIYTIHGSYGKWFGLLFFPYLFLRTGPTMSYKSIHRIHRTFRPALPRARWEKRWLCPKAAHLLNSNWLVVYLPLWKIWKSVGMMTFPTEWEK